MGLASREHGGAPGRARPRILFEPLSAETRATVLGALAPGERDSMPDGEVRPLDTRDIRRAAGLLLGSPEFQKQ
ncbi:hypothetical protein ACN28S_23620 [Cystobacter fuscus]